MDLRKVIFTTAGIGAGLMYLFDPASGRRRRAMLRDKAIRGAHVTRDALGVTSRDMENRIRGLAAEVRRLFSKEEVDKEVLVERVRSQLGGAVSHPGSISVDAADGHVVLSGVVLANEIKSLMKRVRSVRGVKEIDNRLETHEEPGNIPGLQGEPSRRLAGGRFELMQTNWSPAARLLTGLTGGAVAIYGMSRRGLGGTAAMLSGAALFTRALTNMELRRIIGVGGGRRGIDIQKTIHVDAPVETVFEALSRFEDFPNFMRNVQKVSRVDGDRYRWTVSGPGEMPVEWDSVLTSNIPNQELAWRTEPGAVVQHAGSVKFISNPDGGTTVEVRLTYNPLGGAIGHAFASLVGSDPKTRLDEDLSRMKTFVETGKEPRDAAAARH